jgi:hypothetical protein
MVPTAGGAVVIITIHGITAQQSANIMDVSLSGLERVVEPGIDLEVTILQYKTHLTDIFSPKGNGAFQIRWQLKIDHAFLGGYERREVKSFGFFRVENGE